VAADDRAWSGAADSAAEFLPRNRAYRNKVSAPTGPATVAGPVQVNVWGRLADQTIGRSCGLIGDGNAVSPDR
jgi:hypothetical protein